MDTFNDGSIEREIRELIEALRPIMGARTPSFEVCMHLYNLTILDPYANLANASN